MATFANAGIVELSTSKFAAQYGFLRHLAESKGEEPRYAEALSAMRKLEASFPDEITVRSGAAYKATDVGRERVNELYWRSIDVLVYSSRDAGVLAVIPERIPRPIGGKLDAKPAIELILAALKSSSKAWEDDWKRFESDVRSQIQVWTGVYGGHVDPDLRKVSEKLGMERLPEKVEFLVLPYFGGKEGMTLQTLDGWKVVIGAKAFDSTAFAEVVLHEATHVLDVLNRESGYLAKLRKALADANRSPAEIEQIPHVTIFIAAAERIHAREPNYKSVGDRSAFERLPKPIVESAKAGFARLPDQVQAVRELLAKLG